MANQLITQQIGPVCNQALGILRWSIILPRLLTFDTAVSGNIAEGMVVNVRKPATLLAKDFDRAVGIEIQDIREDFVPVRIDKIWDVSVALTSEELTLELTDFGQQVTQPAVFALATKAENYCVDLLASASADTVTIPTGETSVEGLIDAVAVLNQKQAALSMRSSVVGTKLAAELKKSKVLLPVDSSGSSDTLREAIIGRVSGTTVYEDPYMPETEGYMFTKDAAVLTTRAMKTIGTSFASARTFEGFSLRTVIDYDPIKKQSYASFDVLPGRAVLDKDRIVHLSL